MQALEGRGGGQGARGDRCRKTGRDGGVGPTETASPRWRPARAAAAGHPNPHPIPCGRAGGRLLLPPPRAAGAVRAPCVLLAVGPHAPSSRPSPPACEERVVPSPRRGLGSVHRPLRWTCTVGSGRADSLLPKPRTARVSTSPLLRGRTDR